MNETTAEAIILAINALGAGVLLFVSGVAQKIMNDMDELAFKNFLNALGKAAMSDPFAVAIATIPVFVVIFYFAAFGFNHGSFTAGIIVWMIAASITKVTNMPVYKWVGDPKNTDLEQLRRQRRKLQLGNDWRAWLTLVSVVLMVCQFSVPGAILAVVACVVIAPPSLWLARKYMPK